jgi:Phosphoinositide phospholipase C, Ca2+-dependent
MRGDLALAIAALAVGVASCGSSGAPNVSADAGDDVPAANCPAKPTPRAFVKGGGVYAKDAELRVNHLQAKGTHNSYHLRPKNPVSEWDYEHVPLDQQLESQGVRGVELDLQWDPDCERFRVFHVGILDEKTTCAFFTDCLVTLRGWSEAHPGHQPIFVHLEAKNGFTSTALEARLASMEAEILTVFDRRWLLTPDDVKGSSPSLAEAVRTRGWPTLGEARGRFVFYLDDTGSVREVYTHGERDLDGRLVFADGNATEPFVALRILNDPESRRAEIADALAKNQIVRTRADSNPADAKAGSTAQRTAALASGAQIISTDFPAPVAGVPYSFAIEDGTPSRCASGVAPASCTARDIEDPSKLAR